MRISQKASKFFTESVFPFSEWNYVKMIPIPSLLDTSTLIDIRWRRFLKLPLLIFMTLRWESPVHGPEVTWPTSNVIKSTRRSTQLSTPSTRHWGKPLMILQAMVVRHASFWWIQPNFQQKRHLIRHYRYVFCFVRSQSIYMFCIQIDTEFPLLWHLTIISILSSKYCHFDFSGCSSSILSQVITLCTPLLLRWPARLYLSHLLQQQRHQEAETAFLLVCWKFKKSYPSCRLLKNMYP